ncbi:terminase family protein [uncultured Lentibacter sp.]|uniref:DNA-packaging protein n=1 Tax=uncultured Lentibacter sp. TaxID=1659309 RepID=UPI00262B832C|nr:terminase family protein [uncultured Lentibacter sp.]
MTPRGLASAASWIASEPPQVQSAFLSSLTEAELLALPYLFEFWALPHQLAPAGRWRNWVIMGGRGAGKTRAGAEWVRSSVEGPGPRDAGRLARIALVGETVAQVREVMIFGESGIMACSPPDRRPEWQASRGRLLWPNGAVAQVFSAHEPEALRGPQFDGAWVDELAKWKKARETWDMLQFGLRLGDDPRVCITTTPRNIGLLKELLEAEGTVMTHASTEANKANLASGFLAAVQARYAGTRLGRQELDGVLIEEAEGALWSAAQLEATRRRDLPVMSRIVVAVDPPVSGTARSDACGIIVAGVVAEGPVQDWKAYVLEDASVEGASPMAWAGAAVAAMQRWKAERMVAEVNQGGDLVEQVIRQVDPLISLRKVHASRGKVARAEPIAALYEQGRVHHYTGLAALEEEMCQLTLHGFHGKGSPDRTDALVWALTELMVLPAKSHMSPQVRTL